MARAALRSRFAELGVPKQDEATPPRMLLLGTQRKANSPLIYLFFVVVVDTP